MDIHIICIGKLKEDYWRAAISEYSKRLSRFCRLHIHELKEERLAENASAADEQAVREAEGRAILRTLKDSSYTIALAIQGRTLSSEQLAEHLQQLALNGRSDISFIIGGSLGLSPAVLQRANLQLSFSAMTFPHQMMRVILLEQIYRSFKINHHETYHK